MQITAKAAMNGLCFLAIGMFLRSFHFFDSMPVPLHNWIFVLISAAAGFVILWLFFYGLRNFHLAFKLAGPQPSGALRLDKRSFLIAMRFVSVAAGLLLLAMFPDVFPLALQQTAGVIRHGQEFFGSISEGELGKAVEMGLRGILRLLYPIGLCAWIVYLLTGTNRIVRVQAKLAKSWFDRNARSQS
jgi:hypothetical protein